MKALITKVILEYLKRCWSCNLENSMSSLRETVIVMLVQNNQTFYMSQYETYFL